MPLSFEDWGLIDYEEALRKQESYVEEVRMGRRPSTVVFCSHPPIVTKGRGTLEGDITDWAGPVAEINRGGRATYHGPNQIVVYPIISLLESSLHRKARDVGSFLREFENAIVMVLSDLGIKAQGKSYQPKDAEQPAKEETGVWVGSKKVASLGLSVRHWVSYHGAALNVHFDPKAFQGLLPCGFKPQVMTTIEELLGAPPDGEFIKSRLQTRITEYL